MLSSNTIKQNSSDKGKPMSEKYTATIDVTKALAGVPFGVLAAVGAASGNLLFAGLAALPSTVLAAYDTIKNSRQARKIGSQEEHLLEIRAPFGWKESDIPAWKDLCASIEQCLPSILRQVESLLKQKQGPVTEEGFQQIFLDALVDELRYTWLPTLEDRRRVATYVASPLLGAMNQTLTPFIEQMRREADSRKLHEIGDDIRGIHDAFIPPKLSDEEMIRLRQGYFDAICREGMLDFKGISHHDMTRPVSIPLTAVFVLPDVLVGMPEYETLDRDDVQERQIFEEGQQKKHREVELEGLSDWERPLSKRKRIVVQREDLSPILAKHSRLVILGDPGAGKSTLLRYFLLTLAGENSRFVAEFPQLAAEAAIVSPLYIRLATYAEAWHVNEVGEKSLVDFLPRYLRDNYLGAYTEMLLEQLRKGTLILLFDGLDEIPDAAMRTHIVRQIEAFTLSYPDNRFIITSRIVGYKQAPVAAGYQAYTLADFSQAQIKAFTEKWCPAYERWVNLTRDDRSLQRAATHEAEKLFLATKLNPGIKRLAVNPLLLTILALIQRQGIELPNHRVELFDLCATTLLDTWVKARGQTEPIRFSKSDLIKILRPLTFWMHQHPAVGAIPEEELIEQIIRQLLERKVTRYEDEAAKLAEQFLQTVRGKTGILIERGKGRYGFLHLTFEEYFAARDLVSQKNRISFIKQHLHESRWREVILLAIGYIGIVDAYETDVTELVQEAILRAESPFERWLHRDLLFAGLCLADDIGISAACGEEIIEQIVYLYLTSPYDSFRTACTPVLNAWKDMSVGTKATQLVLSLQRCAKMLSYQ
jgi:hypothetical protein